MISDATRYHEAGHAIGALKLGIGLDDAGIEINSDEEACTHICIPNAECLKDADYCVRRAAIKLSGPAAQLIFENRRFTPQELETEHRTFQDLKEAERILQQYWNSRGERDDHKFQQQLDEAGIVAQNVVAIHWDEVETIVGATKETGCVTAENVRRIVRPAKSFIEYLNARNQGERDTH